MSEKINCAKDFEKMLKPLEKMIGYKAEFKRAFGPNGDKIILPAYRVMKSQLLVLAPVDGKKVSVSNNDKQIVRRAAEMMAAITIDGQISQYFRDFADVYLSLLITWNLQLARTRTIDVMGNMCQRILNDMMTMRDTTEVMTRTTKKLRESLRYQPPAFELSRHYLKSLQDDIEKNEVSK